MFEGLCYDEDCYAVKIREGISIPRLATSIQSTSLQYVILQSYDVGETSTQLQHTSQI